MREIGAQWDLRAADYSILEPLYEKTATLPVRIQTLAAGAAIIAVLFSMTPSAFAELKVEGQGILFYTDDVGIFSATRRLSRDGDPTQPALDSRLTNQGSDVVFEPRLDVAKSFFNRYGTTTIDVRGQGFIFTGNQHFNQGSLRVQGVHKLTPETRIRLRYYYAPDQFLGDNEEGQSGMHQITAETLTGQISSARVEREFTPGLEMRLLARYGLRRYNENFSERNTDFSTIGPHLEWKITHESHWESATTMSGNWQRAGISRSSRITPPT
ncbi:MAG: hypothetical protein ACREJN_01975 [Nitrospiraceae bacterium]